MTRSFYMVMLVKPNLSASPKNLLILSNFPKYETRWVTGCPKQGRTPIVVPLLLAHYQAYFPGSHGSWAAGPLGWFWPHGDSKPSLAVLGGPNSPPAALRLRGLESLSRPPQALKGLLR